MNQYDNRGVVSLWSNSKATGKMPVIKGNVVAHRDIKEGETLNIALWNNVDKDGNDRHEMNPKAPKWRGKISDKYVKPRHIPDPEHEELPDNVPCDDDIPY